MTVTQRELFQAEAAGGGRSQAARILAELEARRGHWVPMPELWRVSGAMAVHSRIAELRGRGHAIEHRNEHQDGVVKSFYRLI
jgi:Helix-turn-helix domain